MIKNIFGLNENNSVVDKKKMKELEENVNQLNSELKQEMYNVIENMNDRYDITEKNLLHFANCLDDMIFFINEDFEIYNMNKKAKKYVDVEKDDKGTYGFLFDICNANNCYEHDSNSVDFIKSVLQEQIYMYEKKHENEENSPLKTSEDFDQKEFEVKTKYGTKNVFVSITMQTRSDNSNYYIMILKDNKNQI